MNQLKKHTHRQSVFCNIFHVRFHSPAAFQQMSKIVMRLFHAESAVFFPSSSSANAGHALSPPRLHVICFISEPTKRRLAATKQTALASFACTPLLGGRPFPVISAPLKTWQLPGPGVIPSTLPAHNVYPGRVNAPGLLKEVFHIRRMGAQTGTDWKIDGGRSRFAAS